MTKPRLSNSERDDEDEDADDDADWRICEVSISLPVTLVTSNSNGSTIWVFIQAGWALKRHTGHWNGVFPEESWPWSLHMKHASSSFKSSSSWSGGTCIAQSNILESRRMSEGTSGLSLFFTRSNLTPVLGKITFLIAIGSFLGPTGTIILTRFWSSKSATLPVLPWMTHWKKTTRSSPSLETTTKARLSS